MARSLLAPLLAVALLALPSAVLASPSVCALTASPRVLASTGPKDAKGSQLLQVWEVPDAAVYWSDTAPDSNAYRDFMAGVERSVTVRDPVTLLQRSPAFGAPLLLRYNQLVASRAADWIRPAGCLERLLMAVQHDRVDTFARPTEFAAFVLRSPDQTRLRVYYLTLNEDWIGRVTPITERVLEDHKAGWTVLIGLHNHNFHPGQPALDGVLAPSEADAQLARTLAREAGLEAAWITNGLHTSHIPAQAFDLFQP